MSMKIVTLLNTLDGEASFDSVKNILLDKVDSNITLKKINDNDSLFLVHNDFNTQGSTIYNECRSLCIKISDNNARIIMFTHDNIKYMNFGSFLENDENDDIFEDSYEGTLISIFYSDEWHFTTSRCTSIDSSYFYNSDVTFGNMFDECLTYCDKTRNSFTEKLDKNHCYSFVLIHHKNKYVVDYTDVFGENYAKLALVIERDVDTLDYVQSELCVEIPELILPKHYHSISEAMNDMIPQNEGIICKQYVEARNTYEIIKIQTNDYINKRKRKPNYSNIWYSYVRVFLDNDPDFNIVDFRHDNNLTNAVIIDDKSIDIVGLIHLLYKQSAKILMDLVMHFTDFDYTNQSFTKINVSDYALLSNKKFNIIKKLIATIQTLVKNSRIKNAHGIINHLRRYVSVGNFFNLLRSIQELHDTTSLVQFNNDYYVTYLEFIIDQTQINNREIE